MTALRGVLARTVTTLITLFGVALVVFVGLFVGVVLAGPTDEASTFRRILGLGNDEPRGTPADVAPGGVHAFLRHQPHDRDEPVAWDPCREIHYEVNPDGAHLPADDAVAFVADGIAEISRITGLEFTYYGTTDRRPQWERAFVPVGRREAVLIAWAPASEVEILEGRVIGVGGAVAQSFGGREWLRYVSGAVTLDSEDFDELSGEPDGAALQRAVLLHELGHLVGLDHVDSEAELMHADNVGQLDFGQGDLNGLVRLGRGDCA